MLRDAQGSPAIISAEDAAAPVGAGAAGGHSAICAVQHEAPPGEQPPWWQSSHVLCFVCHRLGFRKCVHYTRFTYLKPVSAQAA